MEAIRDENADSNEGYSGDSLEDNDLRGGEEDFQELIRLRRDGDDEIEKVSHAHSKKQKAKKKPRHQPISFEVNYANSPRGAGSLSKFAGVDDEEAVNDASKYFSTDKDTSHETVHESWDDRCKDRKTTSGTTLQSVLMAGNPKHGYTDADSYIPWSTNDGSNLAFATAVCAPPDESYQDVESDYMVDRLEPLQPVPSVDNANLIPPIMQSTDQLQSENEELQEEDNGGLWDENELDIYLSDALDAGSNKEPRMATAEEHEYQVQRLKDELLNMKVALENTKKAHQVRVDQLGNELADIEHAYNKVKAEYQSEQHKANNEKKRCDQELEKRAERIVKLEHELSIKDKIINNLSAERDYLKDAYTTLKADAAKAKSGPCKCNMNVNEFKQRAQIAEAMLLRMKRQTELRGLEKSRQDGQKILLHLNDIIEKSSKEDEPRMLEYKRQWEANLRQLTAIINGMNWQFDEQIRQLESGVPLSTLSPINVPPPPPPPQPPSKSRVNNDLLKSDSNRRINEPAGTTTAPSPILHNSPSPVLRPVDQAAVPIAPGSFVGGVTQMAGPSNMNAGVFPTTLRPVLPPPGFQFGSNLQPQFGSAAAAGENSKFTQRPPATAASRPISSPPITSPSSQITASSNASSMTGTTADPSAAAATATKPVSKVDTLVKAIQARLPHLKHPDVLVAIEAFRKHAPNQTLKGIPYEELVTKVYQQASILFPRQTQVPPAARSPVTATLVSQMANAAVVKPPSSPVTQPPRQAASIGAAMGGSRAKASAPAVKVQSAAPSSQFQQSIRREEECFVCLEKLSRMKVLNMDCGHRAHELCLQKWFEHHKSCPVCRQLALPPDEYPALFK